MAKPFGPKDMVSGGKDIRDSRKNDANAVDRFSAGRTNSLSPHKTKGGARTHGSSEKAGGSSK